jgi:energy-coupling factor transport system ATP-binding protein
VFSATDPGNRRRHPAARRVIGARTVRLEHAGAKWVFRESGRNHDRDRASVREAGIGMHPRQTAKGPLRPGELAEAVVLADLSLALTVVAQFLPLGTVLVIAAVVPLAVVSARHRLRAVIAGAIAAASVGFLVIGTGAFTTMAFCAAFGALVGAADRRGWSLRKTMGMSLVILWPALAIVTDLLLVIFSNLRKLTLDQVENGWTGLFNIVQWIADRGDSLMSYAADHPLIAVAAFVALVVLNASTEARRTNGQSRSLRTRLKWLWEPIALVVVLVLVVEGAHAFVAAGHTTLDWILDNWWISIPLFLLIGVLFGTWLVHGMAVPALMRIRAAFGPPVAETAVLVEPDAPPAPVPAQFDEITYRYPNADVDAVAGVSFGLEPGEFVAIVGRNGSGQSTLARIIAGRRAPTSGTIDRPGAVGLGQPHGTSLVFQRPEAQVLGVRVRDDVVWGLHDPSGIDIERALERVGLLALADRETSTLSGGELQRLAIAAAIAREPQLLVSDESTAMIDAEGRVGVVELLRALADDGVSVVHVSHAPNEAAVADRTLALDHGRVVPRLADGNGSAPLARRHAIGPPLVELRNVGHVYSSGTPWANRALEGVDLTIHRAESVLVVGHNGSGKTTLAWIMAGLVVPTEGEVLADGKPMFTAMGTVSLAFQHARLQVLRPVVLDEVRNAARVEAPRAYNALRDVGLDASFATRRVDELSGGQLRRVVLASVIARGNKVIVLDEPFAGLDAEGRADLEALLVRLREELSVALVIVSHDYDLPESLVERVVELRAGRIVRDERTPDPVDESGKT